jgi:hypothetical protein
MENTHPSGAEPQVEAQPAPEPEATSSGLPSDVKANTVDITGFTPSEDMFKDGKLKGRFSSIDEVLEKLKEAEDFKANTIRDKTEAEKAQQTEAQKAEQQAQLATVQQETIMDMLPEFMENGMALTPDMEARATEAGIDVRDLKLGALELKERITTAHSVVGGAEQYNAMLAWGKENLTEAQRAAFDKDVTGGMSELAIEGMYARYQRAVSEGHTPPRIDGEPASGGIRPYSDRRELYKDKDYLATPAGRRDVQAQRNYQARLKATPNHVLGLS